MPLAPPSDAEPHVAAISAVAIHKTYDTVVAGAGRAADVPVLGDIDLQVAPGSFVTLFGPSGCGKSTLLRIAAGLEAPSRGEIRLFGEPPRTAAARKWISWTPQAPALLPWLTLRQNLALPLRINRGVNDAADPLRQVRGIDEVLEEAGLADHADAMPSQLSGGMRQRVALARAFVLGAPLMFMDEPFSALDELARNTLCRRLLDVWDRHRKTVLFVTHSAFEAVLLSDRILVMTAKPGRIHAEIAIDLPRPRTVAQTETPAFAALVNRVRRALNEDD